jgi:hypothetical protein
MKTLEQRQKELAEQAAAKAAADSERANREANIANALSADVQHFAGGRVHTTVIGSLVEIQKINGDKMRITVIPDADGVAFSVAAQNIQSQKSDEDSILDVILKWLPPH